MPNPTTGKPTHVHVEKPFVTDGRLSPARETPPWGWRPPTGKPGFRTLSDDMRELVSQALAFASPRYVRWRDIWGYIV